MVVLAWDDDTIDEVTVTAFSIHLTESVCRIRTVSVGRESMGIIQIVRDGDDDDGAKLKFLCKQSSVAFTLNRGRSESALPRVDQMVIP